MKISRTALLPFTAVGVLLLAPVQAHAQNMRWIQQIGTTAGEESGDLAPDGVGGTYVCGTTWGSLGGPSVGAGDAWLRRVNTQGTPLWSTQFGSTDQDFVYGAAADGSGGVYVAGATSGSMAAPIGGLDAWLAHFDGAGNQLWIQQFGTASYDGAYSAAPDGAGGLYVCGATMGSFGAPWAGAFDAWVARYDSLGNQVWVRQLCTAQGEAAHAAVPDGAGGVYLCGWTSGSLSGTNPGSLDAWIARYDGAGNQLWIQQYGTSASDIAWAAAADGAGGVLVTGSTEGSLGGASSGGSDAWVARYDSAGNQVWVRQFGTNDYEESNAAASDGSGGAIVGGWTRGSLGGASAGELDAWLARFDAAGNLRWTVQFGTAEHELTGRAASDGAGGVYVCGKTGGVPGGASQGLYDTWLARFKPTALLLCEPGLGGTAACPCSNPPQGLDRGCDNSSATGGALLTADGDSLLSSDTLVFTAQGERPSALSVLLQGTSEIPGGVVFGQGVRCSGGFQYRLFVRTASAGSVIVPNFLAGDPSISARSAALGATIQPGQSRWYTMYYRDPVVLGGCPATSTFNTGPTMRVDWEQ